MRIFKDEIKSRRVRVGHWIASMAALGCVVFGLLPYSSNKQTVKAILLSCWIVGVPLWFAFETFYLYDPKSDASLEEFKHAQDVASKVWIAISLVLTALYFGKDGLRLP
jgi:hypothetical protein